MISDRRWLMIGVVSALVWTAIAYGIAVLVKSALAAEPATIQGHARVIDGDTIVVGATRVRLYGIDAPELHQTCEMPWGSEACGEDARRALEGLIAGRPVICLQSDTDRYGRAVAACAPVGSDPCPPDRLCDTLDLGREMVRRGWAVDYKRYSRGIYANEEAAARRAKLGIWAGKFTAPAEWRREHRRTR